MRAYATCLWPGLPRLWIRGQWSGLWQAVAFAVALNLVLVSTLAGSQFFPAWSVPFVWITLASVWGVCAVRAYRGLAEICVPAALDERGLFLQAQDEYLKGHWYEAEALLQQQLRQSTGDVDAHLMLATLYRHTRRIDDADRQLQAMERIDGAEKWRWEIDHERRLLKRLPTSGRSDRSDREDTQRTSSF